MSLESALQFTVKMVKAPELHDEVIKTVAGKDPKAASTAIAALGKKHGFEFTAEEAFEARSGALHLLRKEGMVTDELPAADLDKVSGGMKTPDFFTREGWAPLWSTSSSDWKWAGDTLVSKDAWKGTGQSMVSASTWSNVGNQISNKATSFFSGW
ncbi:MAG: Nif11 family protein [Alphaproteobacteria bacterium]|nr:Nif11 family protein [Alphaproteobacteria bacterium]